MTIRVGAATRNDIPKVVASTDALVATDAGRYDAAATNLDWAAQSGHPYCAALLASGDCLVLVARDGDDVVGHLIGHLSGPGRVNLLRIAELESIHVYPAHRGRDIGEQLITTFLAWAAEKGAARATVTAYAANDGAQRFYARHGFAPRSVILDRDVLPPVAGG